MNIIKDEEFVQENSLDQALIEEHNALNMNQAQHFFDQLDNEAQLS